MKRIPVQLIVSVFLGFAIGILLCGNVRPALCAENENHCFTCHTNARKLIQITREIAKTDKEKPGASTETEGEG